MIRQEIEIDVVVDCLGRLGDEMLEGGCFQKHGIDGGDEIKCMSDARLGNFKSSGLGPIFSCTARATERRNFSRASTPSLHPAFPKT